jgi:hypothetical protein
LKSGSASPRPAFRHTRRVAAAEGARRACGKPSFRADIVNLDVVIGDTDRYDSSCSRFLPTPR